MPDTITARSEHARYLRRRQKDFTGRTASLDDGYAAIIGAIEAELGVTWREMASTGRRREVTDARHVVRELALELGMGLREAAHRIRKCHSTFSEMRNRPLDAELLERVRRRVQVIKEEE